MSEILKPSDLIREEFSTQNSNSQRKLFAVFGKPIGHSLSPLMQNKALEEIAKSDAKFIDAKYYAFEVNPENLAEVLEMFWEKNFTGINLTIPHKEVAMKVVQDFDSSALSAKACNTLLRTPTGWKGYNTDGFGVRASIEQGLKKNIENASVVILGAGGASRGATVEIINAGCKSLLVANRNQDRLKKFIDDFESDNFTIQGSTLENIEEKIPNGAIIINATSVGLKDSDKPIIDFSKIPNDCVFLDMPYRRDNETTSVISARKNSIQAENGLAMLAWQGAKSLSIWTDKQLYGSLMLNTLKEHLYGHK